jgi:hypothetical protein
LANSSWKTRSFCISATWRTHFIEFSDWSAAASRNSMWRKLLKRKCHFRNFQNVYMLAKVTKSNLKTKMLLLSKVNKSSKGHTRGHSMPMSSSTSIALSVAVGAFFTAYCYCYMQFGLLVSYWFGWLPAWVAAYLASSFIYSLSSFVKSSIMKVRSHVSSK